MNKIESYDKTLINISPKEWPAFLQGHAHLPDGSINIELAKSFAETATLMDFKRYIRLNVEQAPANSEKEFLAFCSVLGYGVYLSKYFDSGLLSELKARANDPRENIREAVVIALQYIGDKNMQRLLDYLDNWIDGSPLEQKAAIAALCEPDFLRENKVALTLLDLLDWATASVTNEKSWDEEHVILITELEHAWSRAISALPAKGKMLFERWIKVKKTTVSEILKTNLEQPLLQKCEPEWAERMLRLINKS